MVKRILLARGLWICVAVFIADTLIVFVPLVAFATVIFALVPRWGVAVTTFYIRHYNAIHDTHFEILDISKASDKPNAVRLK